MTKPSHHFEARMTALLASLGATRLRSLQNTPAILAAFREAEINTPIRVGHALAQMFHESGSLRWLEEIWGPTRQQRRYDPASGTRLSRSLGNTQRGDGALFRGRGSIMLTGRGNYLQFQEWLYRSGINEDIMMNPSRVANPNLAHLVFAFFWSTRRINDLAVDDTRRSIRRVTRKINGGYNGYSDRRRYFMKAMKNIRVLLSYEGTSRDNDRIL